MTTRTEKYPAIGDADRGHEMIEWVRRNSPVLDGYVRKVLSDGSIKGRRVAVVVHLEAKTAFLATVLADAGAEVVAAGSNPRTTHADVVAALRDRGIQVVADAGGDHTTWERELLSVGDYRPEFIVDDGAEVTMRLALHRPDVFAGIAGVSEETTTGTARLEAMFRAGRLSFGALTANDARCKHLFDNRFGTGQTTIQALLSLTGMSMAGSKIAVIGYGYVGRGIAQYAHGLGGRVLVVETDPVRSLEANMDGHQVGTAADLLPEADAVLTATGGMRAVGAPEIAVLRNGAVLANAGHHDLEVDVEYLAEASTSPPEVEGEVTTYTLGDRKLDVLSGGALVNIAGGSGHPVEIMDLTFAVQGLGVHHLVNQKLAPGVHVLPKELDDAIAAANLESRGIVLDDIRPDQFDDFSDWK